MKPIIGVVPDYQPGGKDSYSLRPHYALRCNYLDSISKAGGIAIVLSYEYELISDYLDLLDGLVIIGGAFDINPHRYQEFEIHPTVKLNLTRENFEYEIVSAALKTSLPFFGICNGMQLLNILHHGSIIQNITDDPQFINHEQVHDPKFTDYSLAYHQINLNSKTKLADIIKQESIFTNSSHHQAVKKIGSGLVVAAQSVDGIVEAIEKPNHPFCIGVQWHPEFNSNNSDKEIFNAFIAAAKQYKKIKNDARK